MDRKKAAKTFARINYSMFVLAAAGEKKLEGCIVNSFHQVTSSSPYQFTVAVNQSNETCKAVVASGAFAISLLKKETPKDILDLFGYKSGRVVDKFQEIAYKTDEAGNPYLTEHTLARVSCKVVDKLTVGNYMLFVAEVTEVEELAEGMALTLDDVTNAGQPTPPTATVYREVEQHGWRCTVCGYVHEAEELPDDYRCPVCKAGKDKFERFT